MDSNDTNVTKLRITFMKDTLQGYESLPRTSRPVLSHLIDDLLKDWLVTQELKQLFKEKGLSE